MTHIDTTAALVDHLEAALRRLEVENYEPSGSCAACLQDTITGAHMPSCYLAVALKEIEAWRAGMGR